MTSEKCPWKSRSSSNVFLPGQSCHVGPAVLSGTINLHRGQSSSVVPPTHSDQALSNCPQVKIHSPLVHWSTLEKHHKVKKLHFLAALFVCSLNLYTEQVTENGTVSLVQYPGPLVVAGVVSVQQVAGGVSTVVPGRTTTGSEDEAPQHRQAVVAPLGRQLRFHLPASCFTIQPANVGAQLLSTIRHLHKERNYNN